MTSKFIPLAAYDEEYAQGSPLVGKPFELRLAVYLWRSSYTEQVAAGCFHKLARWSRLSSEEKETAQRFAEQEHNHAELLKALGKEYLKERPSEYIRSLRVPSEPWLLLAGVSQAERISFVGFEHMKELGRKMNHHTMVAIYELITREELLHLAWGQPLVRRLLKDQDIGQEMRAYLRTHPISREYRAVRYERPWTDPLPGSVIRP